MSNSTCWYGNLAFGAIERLVPSYVGTFEAYVPSRPDQELCKLYGCSFLHRLNNNENPLGPPESAQRCLERLEGSRAAIYPSGDSFYLRQALARRHRVDPGQIVVGNGANEVIAFVIKAFCQQGDNIITADQTFAVYEWVARFSGVEPRLTALVDGAFDEQEMLARVDARTKVVFLCNPNNPTGGYWSRPRLEHFLEQLGERAIMVVDEAYAEFVTQSDYPDATDMLARYPTLVVFRTFSKMFGLAALRVGYLVGSPEVVNIITRTSIAYSVNGWGQAAALAALEDGERHIARTNRLIASSKAYLVGELRERNLVVTAGEGPFIICLLPISDTLAYRKLMHEGYMIRPMTGFRHPGHVRISLSHLEIMEGLVAALERTCL